MAFLRHIKQIPVLAAALLCCSCVSGQHLSEGSGFFFDTHCTWQIAGENPTAVLDEISGAMESLDVAFDLCYDMPPASLPDEDCYGRCMDLTVQLTERYGTGVSMTCGALTDLWGISDGTYHIPDDDEIAAALETVTHDGTVADGTRYDFGAAAKGYACDEAFRILQNSGAEYGVISLSSSTLLYGKKPDGSLFRAGITDPDGEGYLGIIETEAAFVSTSGGYERYFEADGQRFCHILDLTTGRPAETDLASVTVIVPAENENGGILSDFLSTLICIRGTAEMEEWMAHEEFFVVAADSAGRIYTDFAGFIPDESSGWKLN
jgi:thiamine biosynthesis lipoprotein